MFGGIFKKPNQPRQVEVIASKYAGTIMLSVDANDYLLRDKAEVDSFQANYLSAEQQQLLDEGRVIKVCVPEFQAMRWGLV